MTINKTKYVRILNPTDNFDLNKINFTPSQQVCLHDSCSQCKGTGIKENGDYCFHFISCNCPKCTPSF